ncbi:MAG: cytochrome c3 family protein [Bacillota bacterium]
MSKMRLYLALAVALVTSLAFAAPAFAMTHGGFSATTDACAGCHVAHAAQGAKLLKDNTQTHFCFLCHGDGGTSAPYDIKDGITYSYSGSTKTAVYPSTAGGFVHQWVDDGDNVLEADELKNLTSRHNVWGFVYGDESGDVQETSNIYYWIPGSTNQFTGSGFVCTSCHDPHAGGRTPDANGIITGNPRLLRTTLFGENVAVVSFKMETVSTFTYKGVSSSVFRVIEYKGGSTLWCGACHDKFQTDDSGIVPGAGHATEYLGMWRHPMNVHVIPPPSPPDFNGSIATGTPPEIKHTNRLVRPDTRILGCLTCHRAHSATAAKAGWATSWPRDATDPATGKVQGETSALLRMDNRGVCWNCHRDGKYNCWQDTRVDCSKCHPGKHETEGITCTLCHL